MLFDDRTKMQLAEVFHSARNNAQQAPFIFIACIFSAVGIGVTLFLEGHLLFKLFQSLSGSKGEYWSPEYMSISAGIVAIGFHILAHEHHDSFAIRFVKKSTQYLIPIYLVGVGLIIAAMIVGDGIGAVLDGDTIDWNFDVATPQESQLEQFLSQVTHPVATLAFSTGIGGFAIINIFVVHNLMQRIEQGVCTSIAITKTFRAIKKDYDFAVKCHEAYLENEFDIADLELQADDQYIADQQAAIALNVINDALAPHEEFLKEQQLYPNNRPSLIDSTNNEIDTKQLEKFISKIRALDLAGIKKNMIPN